LAEGLEGIENRMRGEVKGIPPFLNAKCTTDAWCEGTGQGLWTCPLYFFMVEGMPYVVSPYFLGAEIKIFATRCQILWLKFTKFGLGSGSAPYPTEGAYSIPPDPSWI